jgi:hypothetical protein
MNFLTQMPRPRSPRARNVVLGGATLAGLLILGWTVIQAQQPGPTTTTTTEGIVHSFTNAPRGEVDGAVLENGVRLHWPPHLQNRFKDILVTGDQVRAIGRVETAPGGETQFEVQRLTNLRSNRTAENPNFGVLPPGPRGRMAPPAPGPAAVGNQAVRTITGTVRNMNTAPRGEIDGALLDDGVLIHWPPPMQDQFRGLVAAGDRMQATGRMETGPAGDTRLEVQSVTNLRTNQTATNADFAGNAAGPAAPGFATPMPPGEIPVGLEMRLRAIEKRLDQLQHDIDRLRESRS